MTDRTAQFIYYLRHPLIALKTPITPRGMSPYSSAWNLVKWSLQRAWRGYSDWDVSEANSYLTHVMANVVREYAKNHRNDGCPQPFCEDDYDGPTWTETLDVMAVKLRAGADCLDDKFGPEVDALYDALPPMGVRTLVADSNRPEFAAWADASRAAEDRLVAEWRDGMGMLKEHLWGMWV